MLAPFEMSVELNEREFFPGDLIDAEVVVDAGKTVDATISVWLEARLHGRGNSHGEAYRGKIAYRGEVTKGEHRFPVAFDVPNGPFTYHGKLVNLSWFVCARADIAWAIDPKAEQDFNLRYRPTGMELVHVPKTDVGFGAIQATGAPKMVAGLGAAVAGVFVLMGMMVVVANPVEMFLPVSMFLGIGGLVFLLSYGNKLRRKAAEQKLGPVELRLEPQAPGPGETVTLTCEVTPPGDVHVNNVHCEFSAVERVVSGSGTNQTTHTEQIFNSWIPVDESITLTRNEKKVFIATCKIPESAPLSFEFPCNTVEWAANIRIDVPSWPDWVMKATFNVLPNARLIGSEQDSPVATDAAPAEGIW